MDEYDCPICGFNNVEVLGINIFQYSATSYLQCQNCSYRWEHLTIMVGFSDDDGRLTGQNQA